MAKTVKVNIGGKDYSLTGDDENLILDTAKKVNEQINSLKQQNNNLTDNTLAMLTALNIAEEDLKKERYYEDKINSLKNEIDRMNEKLSSALD